MSPVNKNYFCDFQKFSTTIGTAGSEKLVANGRGDLFFQPVDPFTGAKLDIFKFKDVFYVPLNFKIL
jgi:hypothetical protein